MKTAQCIENTTTRTMWVAVENTDETLVYAHATPFGWEVTIMRAIGFPNPDGPDFVTIPGDSRAHALDICRGMLAAFGWTRHDPEHIR